MPWYVLSYDAPEEYYEKSKYRNFRKKMIKFLLDYGTTKMESYTKSTIHFKYQFSPKSLNIYSELKEKFKELNFSISEIAHHNGADVLAIQKIFDEDFKKEYDEDVEEVVNLNQ